MIIIVKTLSGVCGNCYIQDCMDGLKSIPSKTFDLLVTDPPYGIKFNSNHYKKEETNQFQNFDGETIEVGQSGNPNEMLKNDEVLFFDWIPEINRVLKDDAGIIVFTSHKVFSEWKAELEKYFKYMNTIIWIKNNWGMGDLTSNFAEQYEMAIYLTKGKYKLKGRRETNIVYADRIPPHTYNHPTPKPVGCILKYLQTLKPKNVIDPFAGTGFVAEACEQLGINWTSFELDETDIKDIKRRIQLGSNAYKPGKKEQKQTVLM